MDSCQKFLKDIEVQRTALEDFHTKIASNNQIIEQMRSNISNDFFKNQDEIKKMIDSFNTPICDAIESMEKNREELNKFLNTISVKNK